MSVLRVLSTWPTARPDTPSTPIATGRAASSSARGTWITCECPPPGTGPRPGTCCAPPQPGLAQASGTTRSGSGLGRDPGVHVGERSLGCLCPGGQLALSLHGGCWGFQLWVPQGPWWSRGPGRPRHALVERDAQPAAQEADSTHPACRIEKKRAVVPTLAAAVQDPGGREVDWEYFYSLLFTTENLKLVHIACHKKTTHKLSCDPSRVYRLPARPRARPARKRQRPRGRPALARSLPGGR